MEPCFEPSEITDIFMGESTLDIGVATLDLNMNVLFISESFKKMYNIIDGSQLEPHLKLIKMISLCLKEKKPISEMHIIENIQGESKYFSVSAYPHGNLNENKEYSLHTVFLFDMSKLHKHYESKIENEKRKLIGDMAAGTANVILNPLAVIKGCLQLILKNLHEDIIQVDPQIIDQISKHVFLASHQVEQINDHIQHFLLIGKPISTEFNIILLTTVMEEFIPSIQREAVKRNLTLICEYPNKEASLLTHQIYLKQMLLEIVRNSFEASSLGDHIQIRVEVFETSVVFSIIDFGTGIPDDLIPQIRLPFFSTKENSLGLGLCFCDIMIKNMEGKMDIESSHGKTIVSLTLPIIH